MYKYIEVNESFAKNRPTIFIRKNFACTIPIAIEFDRWLNKCEQKNDIHQVKHTHDVTACQIISRCFKSAINSR